MRIGILTLPLHTNYGGYAMFGTRLDLRGEVLLNNLKLTYPALSNELTV